MATYYQLFGFADTLLGISVICPANILQNTATANPGGNLVLNGIGCNVDNNVAP